MLILVYINFNTVPFVKIVNEINSLNQFVVSEQYNGIKNGEKAITLISSCKKHSLC